MNQVSKVAMPLIIMTLLNFSMSFVDTMMLGRVSVDSISAVSSANTPISVMTQIITTLIIGVHILGSKALVNEDSKKVMEVYRISFYLMSIVAIIIVMIGFVFSHPIISFYSTEEIMAISQEYYLIRLIGLLFIPITLIIKTSYDVRKNTKIGLKLIIISSSTHIIFNYILIFGFNLGVIGASIGSLISIIVGVIYILFENNKSGTIKIRELLNLDINDKKTFKEILPINVTEVFNMFFDYLGTSLLVAMLTYVSTVSLASGRILTLYLNVSFSIAMNVATAVLILASRGEQPLKNLVSDSLKFVFLILSPIIITFIFTPEIAIRLFSRNNELLEDVTSSVAFLGIVIFVIPFVTISSSILRSKKLNKLNMYITVGSMWLVRMPIAYILIFKMNVGVIAIMIAALGYFITRVIANLFVLRKVEKNEVI
ncbi:MAG: MATE family efflux transporter [Paenisporosarcina sp.]